MQLGRQLGPYTLERKLGEGGMGAVYAARHARIGRLYAVKVLLPELATRKEALGRFEREARALSALGHPNIVPIHDFAIDADGTAYLVMDLLEGTELSRAIAGGPIDPARARRIAMDVAAGLGAAHRLGVVHRDLKPSNVFLVGRGERERAVLLDFGLAKALSDQAPVDTLLKDKLTASGTIMGTPHYMSPEQARGDRLDPRADVWALGVVLYEMLAGRVPFEGPTIATIFAAILATDPVPPSRGGRAAAPELEALAMRCLEKDRERRPRDGDAVLAVLEGRAEATPPTRTIPTYDAPTIAATPSSGQPPATRATPSTPQSGVGASTPSTAPWPGAPSAPARSAWPLVIGALALFALGGAGALGALWLVLGGRATSTSTVDVRDTRDGDADAGATPTSIDHEAVGAPPSTAVPASTTPPSTTAPPATATPTHTPRADGTVHTHRPQPSSAPSADPQPPPTSTSPSTEGESLVGRVPPGMETSPGAREIADAGDAMQMGDWQGCLHALEHAPETPHVLSLQMSCAHNAHDHATLTRVCARLAERYPTSPHNHTCSALLSMP